MSKEILVLASDGQAVLRAVNRLLSEKGLVITQKGKKPGALTLAGGDQRFLYLEKISKVVREASMEDRCAWPTGCKNKKMKNLSFCRTHQPFLQRQVASAV